MFSISMKGVFRRPVIVIGAAALRFARNANGRACNRYEADLYRNTTPRRRAPFCPVLWVSPSGLLLVMRSAMPLSQKMTLDEDLAIGKQWGATLGEDERPTGDGTTGAM
jgi:hypothetical protein